MKPKYNILEDIYHVTPESPLGVIIDIRYIYSDNKFEYLVAFDTKESLWYAEIELTKDKRII